MCTLFINPSLNYYGCLEAHSDEGFFFVHTPKGTISTMKLCSQQFDNNG